VQLAIFFRERKPKDLSELASLAQQYLDAHANSKKEWPKEPMFKCHLSPTSERKFDRNSRGDRNARPETGRNCGKTGHLARDCEIAQKCVRCGKVEHTIRNCEMAPRCFNCRKVGHASRNFFQPKRVAAMSHE